VSERQEALRILVGFALGYVVGFERGVRGSAAGDRTFSLVSCSTAALVAVLGPVPQVVQGIITGIGFLGGGVILRVRGSVHGVTTAATIFGTAVAGVMVGSGAFLLSLLLIGLMLFALEVRHLPVLRLFDSGHWQRYFADDADLVLDPEPDDPLASRRAG
jgi:putative Mg2+ transporter-C (MgtC) family protein